MSETCGPSLVNYGYCESCDRRLPVARVQRDNSLYLHRECPDCGPQDVLISRDAKAYYDKREFMGYKGEAERSCSLDCAHCGHGVAPTFVVIDVTNRCNMNCPICLANIPAMGMVFNPPLDYFERLFDYVATLRPLPKIQLFGGEPTCREDLLDIMKMIKKRGMTSRLVTNGLKLADEEYCKAVLKYRPQILLGLDGVNPDIQRRLRKNPGSLQKKLQAIDNIGKHTKSKITIMCTTGKGVSEELLPDLFKLMYEKRDFITRIMLIPLQATAGPETIGIESSTVEDVEHVMEECFRGLEFVPAGAVRRMTHIMGEFGKGISIGGSHPNCECFALMVAEPEVQEFRPLAEYLDVSYKDAMKDLMEWDKTVGQRIEHGFLSRMFGEKGKRFHLGTALVLWLLRRAKIRKLLGPTAFRTLCSILWTKMTTGEKFMKVFKEKTGNRALLEVIILPYEEPGCLESARLKDCPVSFVCEHPETGDPTLLPFCAYFVDKNMILKKTNERWEKKLEPVA
jgi:7,8-dihydro-6-hydroxymethylpterin dimethyltransferase